MKETYTQETLTFSQATGLESLPSTLMLGEVSKELRAKLWHVVFRSMTSAKHYSGLRYQVQDPWLGCLYSHYVLANHNMADEFDSDFDAQVSYVKRIVTKASYNEVFDFLQHVFRSGKCPHRFPDEIEWALKQSRAAYTIVNKRTVVPISSQEEITVLKTAFANLHGSQFGGAKTHLEKAAELLTSGNDADSIRESIHAVESVAKKIDPKANSTLGPALAALEKHGLLHSTLKIGFEKIYGYTNAEEGIRHSLIENSKPNVDATDAQFMLGACAAFISYLIAKGRTAKIIQ